MFKDFKTRKELTEFEKVKKVPRNKKYQKYEEILTLLYDDGTPNHALEDLPNYLSITQLINANVSQIETIKKIIKDHNTEIYNNNKLIKYVKNNLYPIGQKIYIVTSDPISGEYKISEYTIVNKGKIRRCPWQDECIDNGIIYIQDHNQFKLKIQVVDGKNNYTDFCVDIISFGKENIDIDNPPAYFDIDKNYKPKNIKYPFFIPIIFSNLIFDNVNSAENLVFENLEDAKLYVANQFNNRIIELDKEIKYEKALIDKKIQNINKLKSINVD